MKVIVSTSPLAIRRITVCTGLVQFPGVGLICSPFGNSRAPYPRVDNPSRRVPNASEISIPFGSPWSA
jgi:hypothetical protein